jgi:N-dimethylarginine dimethylaminohydrolase
MEIRAVQKRYAEATHLQLENKISPSDEMSPSTQFRRPTFLMCDPRRDDVQYAVNPWKAQGTINSSRDASFHQWNRLHQALKTRGDVKLIPAKEGSLNMTFIAHGAVVNYGVAALSSFAHAERISEEDHLQSWLEEAGFIVWKSEGLPFEGEGDALFSPEGDRLWAAHGPRTCLRSHHRLSNVWHIDVVSLHLIDPRFYHLDLCFNPLSGGQVLYYPGAFDRRSLEKIEGVYSPSNRIAVTAEEAVQFACNVINIGDEVLMHDANGVASRVRAAGYRVSEFPLDEFIKRGGAAKSLALRLSDLSVYNSSVGVQSP